MLRDTTEMEKRKKRKERWESSVPVITLVPARSGAPPLARGTRGSRDGPSGPSPPSPPSLGSLEADLARRSPPGCAGESLYTRRSGDTAAVDAVVARDAREPLVALGPCFFYIIYLLLLFIKCRVE